MSAAGPILSIREGLSLATGIYTAFNDALTEEEFFYRPPAKWSPAQQTRHLIIATRTAKIAYRLPGFIVRWVGGRPNRPSRSYEELVERYRERLREGGRAAGRYIPRPVPASYGKEKMLKEFTMAMQKFGEAVEKGPLRNQLDNFLAPHPLLGKVTLRELGYFTIYHSYHHLENIRKMTRPESVTVARG